MTNKDLESPDSAGQMALSGAIPEGPAGVVPPVSAPDAAVDPLADLPLAAPAAAPQPTPAPIPARRARRSSPPVAQPPAEVSTKVVSLVSGAIFIPGLSTPALVAGQEYELDKFIAPGLTLRDATRPEWFVPVSPAKE